MTRTFSLRAAAIATLALSLVVPIRALTDAQANGGRTLLKQKSDAIVGVEMVVTIKISRAGSPAMPRENKVDVNGTVVSSTGLTVTSLAAVDPRVQFEAMRAMLPAGTEVGETDYKEVKLRLADGTELPAKLVLKDADLDLAFIAPDVPANGAPRTFSPVKLEDATDGRVLDEYFVLSRAPKALQRVPMIQLASVTGIVEKPRRLYLLSAQHLGCPVFDVGGKILGLMVQNLSGGRSSGLVVLPAADVAEVAKQAAQAATAQPAPAAVSTPAADPAPAAGQGDTAPKKQ